MARVWGRRMARAVTPTPTPPIRRARLELVPLEDRVVPDGRPLPFPVIAVGADVGVSARVRVYDAETGADKFTLTPYGATFTGGVRVALGDLNSDGYPDVVTAPASGTASTVRAYDGKTGVPLATPLGSFTAYSGPVGRGVSLAVGDLTGDRRPDVVTAADRPGGVKVRVFDGATGAVAEEYTATEAAFRDGASLAVGDVTGDHRPDLVIGAGRSPRVRVLDGTTFQVAAGPLGDFTAFGGPLASGASVAVGDVTGDRRPDLVAGARVRGTARVRVFDGTTGSVVWDKRPFGLLDGGIPRVGAAFVSDDPVADVVVGTGPGVAARVKVLDGTTGQPLPPPQGGYQPFGGSTSGVFLAAANDPPYLYANFQINWSPSPAFAGGRSRSSSPSPGSPATRPRPARSRSRRTG